ncbi:hypothetical protein, partial [Enterobacter asburiae]|uniref:hypothetical protein n=1 Tax=Enterobacter asburiae TaxID=61645 RepID=UPI001B86FA3B
NTDDLFIGKTLLHGDVLMWLMKTLLTSGCTNQRGAGQASYILILWVLHGSKLHKRADAAGKPMLLRMHIPTIQSRKVSLERRHKLSEWQ